MTINNDIEKRLWVAADQLWAKASQRWRKAVDLGVGDRRLTAPSILPPCPTRRAPGPAPFPTLGPTPALAPPPGSWYKRITIRVPCEAHSAQLPMVQR
jgi:hypothetical protein